MFKKVILQTFGAQNLHKYASQSNKFYAVIIVINDCIQVKN